MYLKSDFLQALADAAASRPAAAALYKAGDPRMLAAFEANATMLAMLSAQVDVAEVEPFLRSRDGTVLADAALKGVLPLARSARVSITATNPGAVAVAISAGRVLLDGKGRSYRVEGAATVPAGGSATLTAAQMTMRKITHTVSGSVPFYAIEVPPSDRDLHLVGLEVEDAQGQFSYRPEYVNIAVGERCYHVETDEYRRLHVRFGADDGTFGAVVGHQPANGDVITLTVSECAGKIDLEAGSSFAFEYINTAADSDVKLVLAQVLATGAQPPSVEYLRMLSRYPALHDQNAVYLGDFDFLLRKQMGETVEFLSVWNEQVEEAARGASDDNINRLFFAYSIPGQTDAVTQAQISAIIKRADDGYRITFKPRRDVTVPLTVTAQVSVVHDPDDVKAQILALLLARYGRGSVAASRSMLRSFRLQAVQEMLKQGVTALQDQEADFSVALGALGPSLPEDFCYLTTASITITVTRRTTTLGLWNT